MAGKQAKKKSPKQESTNPFAALAAQAFAAHREPTAEQLAVQKHNLLQKNRYQGALSLMQSGATQFDTAEKALAQVDRLIELTPFQEIPESVESTQSEQAQA